MTLVAEPRIANDKTEEISRGEGWRGVRACPPLPTPSPEVETKICAIWGILEANLKKCSTLKFMTNISFVPSICIHRSIILIFIEKSMLVDFFPRKKYFSAIFDFHFRENPRFPDEFPALLLWHHLEHDLLNWSSPKNPISITLFWIERKGCNNSWTFPRATETFGSITSHFVSLNSDVENTVLYTVLGVREAQINTVIDTVWGSKVVNAKKKQTKKTNQTNKKQSPKVFFIQNLKINT